MYALYARQSRDKKDSISIESQFEFCTREVPPNSNVKKYKDKGFSGKDTDRPAFQQLMQDIRRGLVKTVIVYKLDRMSRSILDFANIVEEFNKYNVEFISSTEKFDTSTPIGKAMLSIVMVFAQLERETIQQRITDNYYERGKKGMFLGGNVPFGFQLSPTKIKEIRTNKLAPTKFIRYVKEMYIEYSDTNASLMNISDKFNKIGVRTSLDNFWDSAKISRLLRNPVYVKADVNIYNYFKNQGCIIHNDLEEFTGERGLYLYGNNNSSTTSKFQNLTGYNLVLAPHEGIIDSNTWLRCQNKLNSNKQIKNSGKSKHSWLSGLVKCRKCGYALSVNRSILSIKNNTYATYFRCSGRALRKICDAKSVHVNEVELKVKEKIFDYIAGLNNKLKLDTMKEDKKINELKIEISSKENEIENLIDSLAQSKGASIKYINQRIEKIDGELVELREQLIQTSSAVIDDEKIVALNKVIQLWDGFNIEDKKMICKELIEKILVEKNGDESIVEIIWNY